VFEEKEKNIILSSQKFFAIIEFFVSIGPIKILPSFTPGIYEQGDGKDQRSEEGLNCTEAGVRKP